MTWRPGGLEARAPQEQACCAEDGARVKAQPDRIQARHFHLTFAALYPGELTFAIIRDAAAEWAGERGKLLEYSTGREKHKEPDDPERDEHFHVPTSTPSFTGSYSRPGPRKHTQTLPARPSSSDPYGPTTHHHHAHGPRTRWDGTGATE